MANQRDYHRFQRLFAAHRRKRFERRSVVFDDVALECVPRDSLCVASVRLGRFSHDLHELFRAREGPLAVGKWIGTGRVDRPTVVESALSTDAVEGLEREAEWIDEHAVAIAAGLRHLFDALAVRLVRGGSWNRRNLGSGWRQPVAQNIEVQRNAATDGAGLAGRAVEQQERHLEEVANARRVELSLLEPARRVDAVERSEPRTDEGAIRRQDLAQ